MNAKEADQSRFPVNSHFATTQWSMVLAAGEQQCAGAGDALARLCETYWYPLYLYVRRRVNNIHEAQDLTQTFFADLLEKRKIEQADPGRGRFRAFLLTALKNFLNNEWNMARTEKRGGGKFALSLDFETAESRIQIEESHQLAPDAQYERRWVMTLLENVLESLRQEWMSAGKLMHFELFKNGLTDELTHEDFVRASELLKITPNAAKQAAYRLRKRYRVLFRQAVAQTVASEEDLDDEIGRLIASLG